MRRMGILTPPLPWDKPEVNERSDEEVVVVLHGLWRSVRAMQPMVKHLSDSGYTTVNIPYASFRYDLDEMVSLVMNEIQPWLEQERKIHFVTHSLGGVVVKRLLELLEVSAIEKIGRVVMLAPPHKGSEIVDWIRNSPLRLFKGVLGPAGEFLSSKWMGNQSEEFRAGVEGAVIMGEKSSLPFFRKLLDASNDGVVSVNNGRLQGIKEFKVVDADHTFISSNRGVMKLVSEFLLYGEMGIARSCD